VSALREIATQLADQAATPVLRVAVDGVDGVGKTTFADLLSEELQSAGREVIRASSTASTTLVASATGSGERRRALSD